MSLDRSMDIVVLTDEADFESALPDLTTFALPARVALTAHTDGHCATADVAIVDARSNMPAAQALSLIHI